MIDCVAPTVHYADRAALTRISQTGGDTILGVIAYGADRPSFLDACPFAASALRVLGAEPLFEVWTAQPNVRYCREGRIAGAYNDNSIFGVLTLDEGSDNTLERLIQNAYLDIFAFLDDAGQAPIRFWNYLPRITDNATGLERYRRFNIGRHDAFSARLKLPVPPVASAVGSQAGAPLIYFLGARNAAAPIENPRQISAYAYPALYGPRSPGFSRASLLEGSETRSLFIAGTASIVGHESRHTGDAAAQVTEICANLEALIHVAEKADFPARRGRWIFKIYLRDPAYAVFASTALDRMFGENHERLFLQAEICRPELLVEIEAVCFVEKGGLG